VSWQRCESCSFEGDGRKKETFQSFVTFVALVFDFKEYFLEATTPAETTNRRACSPTA